MYFFNRTDFENDTYYDFSAKNISLDDIKRFLRHYKQNVGCNLYEFGIDNSRFDQICLDIGTVKKEITIYEFKISRNDWLTDNKWQNYLKYCNRLWFVCPYGIINKNELPDNIGLIHIWKYKNKIRDEFSHVCGNRIQIARKKEISEKTYVRILENMIRKMPWRKEELF